MKDPLERLLPIVEMIETQQREKYAQLSKNAVEIEQSLTELRARHAQPFTDHFLDIAHSKTWNAWVQQEMYAKALQLANCMAAKEQQARALRIAMGRADVLRELTRKNVVSR